MGNLAKRIKYYNEWPNKPLPPGTFGNCPICQTKELKIIWGWQGVYYDLLCKNGHDFTYNFPTAAQATKKAPENPNVNGANHPG